MHWLGSGPVALACTLAAAPPAAGQAPLAQVPAGSPVVVSVRGVKNVRDHLGTLVKNALPDLGPRVQEALDGLVKWALGERKLAGLKDDGPLFLVFPDVASLPSDKPELLAVVGVSDYTAFRDGLLTDAERKALKEDKAAGYESAPVGVRTVYFIKRPDHALVCLDQKTAAALAKGGGKGLDGTLDKDLAEKLLAADVACYVDLAALRAKLTRQILAQWLADNVEPILAGLDRSKLETLKAASTTLLQAYEDGTGLLLTCNFQPQGLALHVGAGFAGDSKSNGFLKTVKPSPLAGLLTLPADQTVYTAVDFGPEAYKSVHPLIKNMLASADEDDETQYNAVRRALAALLAAGPRSWLSATRLGTGRTGLEVGGFAEPARAVDAQVKLLKALKKGGDYQAVPLKDSAVVKNAAETYRGVRLYQARLPWDLNRLAEDMPTGEGAVEALRKMYGDQLTIWFGVLNKQYVQVAAPTWPLAKRYLDQYFGKKSTVGEDRAFTETRGRLPKVATLVTLTSVPRYAQSWSEFTYAILKGSVKLAKPPAEKEWGPPSYVGAALTLQAGRGSFDLWIPAAAGADFRRASTFFNPPEKKK
jgi:hypothetical protein